MSNSLSARIHMGCRTWFKTRLTPRLTAWLSAGPFARIAQRRYGMLAAACLVALVTPIYLASTTLPPGTGAPPPEPPLARIAQPPEPSAAMTGRLFFAAGETLSTDTIKPPAPTPPTTPPPKLLGTALNATGGAVAVFSGAFGQKTAEKGDVLDGWRVISIRNGTAEIRNGAQSETLTLAPPEPTNRAANQRETP